MTEDFLGHVVGDAARTFKWKPPSLSRRRQSQKGKVRRRMIKHAGAEHDYQHGKHDWSVEQGRVVPACHVAQL